MHMRAQATEGMVAATQGSTQSMSMTLGMPGDMGTMAGEGRTSPQKQGGASFSNALAPSATVYRRPLRCPAPSQLCIGAPDPVCYLDAEAWTSFNT